MKKLFVIVSIVMMVLLSGCKKESGLAGTKWEDDQGSYRITLTFTTVQACLNFGDGSSSYYYSYEYTPPTVVMYPEDDDKASLKGIIGGNQMSIVNLSNQKTIGLFTKK